MKPITHITVLRKLNRKIRSIDPVEAVIREYCLKNNLVFSLYDNRKGIGYDPTLMVVLGGDGTMLRAAREIVNYPDVSLVGFNQGNLGFLAEEVPQYPEMCVGQVLDTEAVYDFINSIVRNDTTKVKLDKRTLLVGYCSKCQPSYALNEFLITTENTMHAPTEYQVLINEQPLTTVRSSGMLVSTATGSTAFALSVGGAIIHPSSHVMQVAPIASHSLTARPVVLSEQDNVVKVIAKQPFRKTTIQLVGDGQIACSSKEDTFTVEVRKVGRQVMIWRPIDWNFFDVLGNKFGWK